MNFQNSNGHNLYWYPNRTNKELHAWCLENGIKLPKNSRKVTLCHALAEHMVKCGIDRETHPDTIRARA